MILISSIYASTSDENPYRKQHLVPAVLEEIPEKFQEPYPILLKFFTQVLEKHDASNPSFNDSVLNLEDLHLIPNLEG